MKSLPGAPTSATATPDISFFTPMCSWDSVFPPRAERYGQRLKRYQIEPPVSARRPASVIASHVTRIMRPQWDAPSGLLGARRLPLSRSADRTSEGSAGERPPASRSNSVACDLSRMWGATPCVKVGFASRSDLSVQPGPSRQTAR
jgi:hypothetical protein